MIGHRWGPGGGTAWWESSLLHYSLAARAHPANAVTPEQADRQLAADIAHVRENNGQPSAAQAEAEETRLGGGSRLGGKERLQDWIDAGRPGYVPSRLSDAEAAEELARARRNWALPIQLLRITELPSAAAQAEAQAEAQAARAAAPTAEAAWACALCTYMHAGAKASYLACCMCAAERPPAAAETHKRARSERVAAQTSASKRLQPLPDTPRLRIGAGQRWAVSSRAALHRAEQTHMHYITRTDTMPLGSPAYYWDMDSCYITATTATILKSLLQIQDGEGEESMTTGQNRGMSMGMEQDAGRGVHEEWPRGGGRKDILSQADGGYEHGDVYGSFTGGNGYGGASGVGYGGGARQGGWRGGFWGPVGYGGGARPEGGDSLHSYEDEGRMSRRDSEDEGEGEGKGKGKGKSKGRGWMGGGCASSHARSAPGGQGGGGRGGGEGVAAGGRGDGQRRAQRIGSSQPMGGSDGRLPPGGGAPGFTFPEGEEAGGRKQEQWSAQGMKERVQHGKDGAVRVGSMRLAEGAEGIEATTEVLSEATVLLARLGPDFDRAIQANEVCEDMFHSVWEQLRDGVCGGKYAACATLQDAVQKAAEESGWAAANGHANGGHMAVQGGMYGYTTGYTWLQGTACDMAHRYLLQYACVTMTTIPTRDYDSVHMRHAHMHMHMHVHVHARAPPTTIFTCARSGAHTCMQKYECTLAAACTYIHGGSNLVHLRQYTHVDATGADSRAVHEASEGKAKSSIADDSKVRTRHNYIQIRARTEF